MTESPFTRREPLSPEQEKLGIEFYTAGKVDGGRETLRRIRTSLEKVQIPHEFEGYLPEGWKSAMGEVWHILEDLEQKYQDPLFVAGFDKPA